MPMMVSGTRHGDIGLSEANDSTSRDISSIESKGRTFPLWCARCEKISSEARNHISQRADMYDIGA